MKRRNFLRNMTLASLATPFALKGVHYKGIAKKLFNYSKSAEQNRVWVGLAKETAHQLGTPLSSLMAWIQLLEDQHADPRARPRWQGHRSGSRLEDFSLPRSGTRAGRRSQSRRNKGARAHRQIQPQGG